MSRLHPARFLAVVAPLLACKPVHSTTPLAELPPPPVVTTPAAAPAPLPPPPPPAVYGYFRVADPNALLSQLRTLLPTAQAALFDESLLRSLLAMSLGSSSALAQRIDLTRPMGCVVTSPTRYEAPIACVVAYTGGFTSLVQDLGPTGYVSGGDDYAAYRFEGKPVFITAMGRHVAFSSAPDLIAATREHLQRDLIDAPVGEDEIVAAVYPAAIFAGERDAIEDFLDRATQAPSAGPYAEATAAAQRKQWLSWAELERADLWIDLSDAHVRLGYRGTAFPGTATEKAYADARTLGQDRELLGRLPAGALAVAGMYLPPASLAEDPMLGATMQAFASLDGNELAEQYRESLALWSEHSTGQAALALVHERGTKGGIVMTYRMKPGVDAVPRMREIFEGYREPSRLAHVYDVELHPASIRVGKVRGDRLVMKPTAELLAGPSGAALTRALGSSPALHMAYAQRGDVLYMAMTADAKVDRYLKRALSSTASEGLAARKDAHPLLDEHADDTWVVAANVGDIVAWLTELHLIEKTPSITFPDRLDDVVLTLRPGGERQREVTLDASPILVRTLLELATL